MAVFLLDTDNLEHAKTGMRTVWPQVGASHRAEAFAAAIGYRTLAALLADLKCSAPLRASARQVEPLRFSARLCELGCGVIDPGPLTDIAGSAAMPMRPWAEYKTGDRAANDRWFRECQRRDIPNLRIETRAKYAKLSWDCISQDPQHDPHRGDDEGANLVRTMFARFQSRARHAPGKPEFFGSAFVGSIDRILPDTARDLADEFFIMLTASVQQCAAA